MMFTMKEKKIMGIETNMKTFEKIHSSSSCTSCIFFSLKEFDTIQSKPNKIMSSLKMNDDYHQIYLMHYATT